MLNLIRYNVAGGGDSALYGVESSLFYLRNTFNAFNLALPLALAAPVVRTSCAFCISERPLSIPPTVVLRRSWSRRLHPTGGTSSDS